MGFFKKIGQKAINIVTSPFKNITNSAVKSVSKGATKGLLEQLAEVGLDKEFIENEVGEALRGVVSVDNYVLFRASGISNYWGRLDLYARARPNPEGVRFF